VEAQRNAKSLSLPNGNSVRVISATREALSKPTLAVDYITAVDISDRCALQAEADQVFQAFRERALSESVGQVFVSPNEECKPSSTAAIACRGTAFVYEPNMHGAWTLSRGPLCPKRRDQ